MGDGTPSHSYTGCHLPHGITVLPSTLHKWTHPALTQPEACTWFDLHTPEGWKAELT